MVDKLCWGLIYYTDIKLKYLPFVNIIFAITYNAYQIRIAYAFFQAKLYVVTVFRRNVKTSMELSILCGRETRTIQ